MARPRRATGSTPFRLLLALISTHVLLATPAAAAVCPDVAPARKHFHLAVYDTPISLPGGLKLNGGLTYNKSYIGPMITAVLGEELSIDVENKASIGTSTHWHGQTLYNASWADGVEAVSQMPTPPGATFRYKFKAGPAGTYWYHSHTGMQYPDGLRGPLIIQDPADPYKGQYDEEVVLLLTDQNNVTGETLLNNLETGKAGMMMGLCTDVTNQDISDAPYTTLLTNGKGWVKDPKTGQAAGEPFVVKVQKGKRYRFRVIQGANSWGMKLKVQQHGFNMIALDGNNIQSTPAKGFVVTPGERVDFILTADQPVGNYWIDIATLPGYNSPAVLSYEGAPDPKTMPKPKLNLGCSWLRPESGVYDLKNTTGQLKAHASVPKPPAKANRKMVLYLTNNADPAVDKAAILGANAVIPGVGVSGLNSVHPQNGCLPLANGKPSKYCWSLNWVPFAPPEKGGALLFPTSQPAPTTYVENVALNDVVDIAIINPGAMVHPMHIHGHHYWVLATGNGNILTPTGDIDYSKIDVSASPIYRDNQAVTNAVPAANPMAPAAAAMTKSSSSASSKMPGMGHRKLQQMGGKKPMGAMAPAAADKKLVPGYAVLRFKADNPGVWAFHCHIDLHANSGMFMTIRVAGAGNTASWALPQGVAQCSAA